ncbi:MAG: hypothetical protein ACE366_02985 [Bradymonadia bacterium]
MASPEEPLEDKGSETWQSLAVTPSLIYTEFRDQQLSPLSHGGWSLQLGFALDAFDPENIDRLGAHWIEGAEGNWSWRQFDLKWFYAPRVMHGEHVDLFVGGSWQTGFGTRTLVDTDSWFVLSSLGPGVGGRMPMTLGTHALWFEARAAAPVLGVLGRPGYASATQRLDVSGEEFFLAAPHNVQAVTFDVSCLWIRPKGGDLRLEVGGWVRRVTERHEAVDAGLALTLSAYWRLW